MVIPTTRLSNVGWRRLSGLGWVSSTTMTILVPSSQIGDNAARRFHNDTIISPFNNSTMNTRQISMIPVQSSSSAPSSTPSSSSYSSSSTNNFDTTFEAVKKLAFQLQEPRPLRAVPPSTTVSKGTAGIEEDNSSVSQLKGQTKIDNDVPQEQQQEQEQPQRQAELASLICDKYCTLPSLQLPLSDSCERGRILQFLAIDCSPNSTQVLESIESYQKAMEKLEFNHSASTSTTMTTTNTTTVPFSSTLMTNLRDSVTPSYEKLFEYVMKQNSSKGMQFFLALREDLLKTLRWLRFNTKINNTTASTSTTDDDNNKNNIRRRDDECLFHMKQLDIYLQTLFSIWFSPGMLGKCLCHPPGILPIP